MKKRILNKDKLIAIDRLENLNCQKKKIQEIKNRFNRIEKPTLFEGDDLASIESYSPSIQIFILNNVYLYSSSKSVSDGSNIYNLTLFNMKPEFDIKNPLQEKIKSFHNKEVYIYSRSKIVCDNNNMHVSLLGEHSWNYYHWLFELMPKIIFLNKVIMNSDYSNAKIIILIDNNIHQNMISVLKNIISFKYEIRVVSKYSKVYCKNLLYCSDLWLALDNTKHIPDIKREFCIDREAVKLVYDALSDENNAEKPFRKIYLERADGVGRIPSNQSELRDAVLSYGFEIVKPQELTFSEQRKIFNEAKIVIGVSGAAFSNIIFMREKTTAILFYPNANGCNNYIFQPLADVAKVNLIQISVNSENPLNVHSSVFVDIEKVKRCLDIIN
jgi:hypothetical protein